MIKVAINSDYGGFNLSDQAFQALLDRKGVEYEVVDGRFGMKNYYNKGFVGDDSHYIDSYDYFNNRADLDLIAVIEEYGDRANGLMSSIKIVEIPDEVEWYIEEYDGMEHVAEKHRTWR